MRCADYAIVGARVLSMLTGVRYRPVAGGEVMDFGGGNLFALCSTRERRRAARHLSQLARYHCWIEARHTDADGRARTEVIDFTMRHDARVASMVGMPFTGSRGTYWWGWDDEHIVPAELRDHPAFAKQGRAGAGRNANAPCCCALTSASGRTTSGGRSRVRCTCSPTGSSATFERAAPRIAARSGAGEPEGARRAA